MKKQNSFTTSSSQSKSDGKSIINLDSTKQACRKALYSAKQNGAVAFKCGLAYQCGVCYTFQPQITRAPGEHAQGHHLDPLIADLERDMNKLHGGSFGVNRESTQQHIAFAEEVLAIFFLCAWSWEV